MDASSARPRRDRTSSVLTGLDWLPHTEAYVDALVCTRVEAGISPASAYAVFGPAGIAHSGGLPPLDDVDAGHTAYRIASCTKSFTAAALLMARDLGLLHLDDPIDAFVGARFVGPDGAPAHAPTLHQLATMTGGLPTDDPWADRQESMTTVEFDAMVAQGMRMTRPPGSAWEYSNLGYALVGRAIEVASGRSFIDFLTEDLLVPLDLTGVRLDQSVFADHIMVGRHQLPASPGVLATHWDPLPFSGPGAFSPIGGLFATPIDVARWARWLSNPDLDGPLSPASRLEMQTPQAPLGFDTGWYGYGLRIEDHPRLGRFVFHSGGYPGFGAHMRWHQGLGVGIVMLEGGTYSAPAATATQAIERIVDEVRPDVPELDLWPETLAARQRIDQMLSDYSRESFLQLAADWFGPNVAQDEPLARRMQSLRVLTRLARTQGAPVRPLAAAAASSTSPARLTWSFRGATTSLRCSISLTPEPRPRLQEVKITLT